MRKLLLFSVVLCMIIAMSSCANTLAIDDTIEVVSVAEDVTDEHIINRFYDSFENISEWVRDDFTNHGWSVQLFNNLSEAYGSDINGLTVYNDKIIYINATDSGTAKHVMAHEMGHYLDWALDWISFSDEFRVIFDDEYSSFSKNINSQDYIENNPAEYWADCCFYYMALPQKLETYCPVTYEYIDTNITDYSGVENIPIAYN